MPLLASLPLLFSLPPDGADDVPADARVVAVTDTLEAVRFDVTVDGEPWPGERVIRPDYVAFEPDQPWPDGAWVEADIQIGGEGESTSFQTAERLSVAPGWQPDVGPVLHAEVLQAGDVPRWLFRLDAIQPEAEPYGFFRLAYRSAGDEDTALDIAWPASTEATTGEWEDQVPAGGYCVGVGYIDIAGNTTDPVEICTDLSDRLAEATLHTGCVSAPAAIPTVWTVLLLVALARRRD